MNKIKNTKGFTLMEMLIVVAIIAVLVAIAIPTFTTSLNKARVATDQANIRSGYAAVMAEVLSKDYAESNDNSTATGATYKLYTDGSVAKTTETVTGKTEYKCFGNVGDKDTSNVIAGQTVDKWKKNATVTYVYEAEKNTVKITVTNP